jgi:lipopolysaccharide biosynthesis glycosyltransferase
VLLPELLPEAPKVLYLDADTLVVDALGALWHTELGDAPLAAVANPLYRFMDDHPRWRLGISDRRRYLNSGVLLMNLELMRREGTAAALLAYARDHPDNVYPDQDAISALFADRHVSLHPRWNAQTTLWDLRPGDLPFAPSEVEEARQDPAIVHFVGPFKPWHYLCTHPYRAEYFEHLQATPWAAPPLEGRTPVNAVLRRLSPVWVNRWYRARQALTRQRAGHTSRARASGRP